MMSQAASEDTVIIQYVTESGDVIQTVGDGGTVVIDEQGPESVTMLGDATALQNEADAGVTQQVILLEDSDGNVTQQTIVMDSQTDAADEDGSRANGDSTPVPEDDSTTNHCDPDDHLLPPAVEDISPQSPRANIDAMKPSEQVDECKESQTADEPNHQNKEIVSIVQADVSEETPKIPTGEDAIKSRSDIEGEDEEIISLINQISENDTSQLKNQVEPDTKFPANFLADDQSDQSEDQMKSQCVVKLDRLERNLDRSNEDRSDRRIVSERATEETEDKKADVEESADRPDAATPFDTDDDIGQPDEAVERSSESDQDVDEPEVESPMDDEEQDDDDSPKVSSLEKSPRENLTAKHELLGSVNLTDTNAARKRRLSKETVRKTYPLRRQTRDAEDDLTDSSFRTSSPGFSFWSDSDTEQKRKRGRPRKYPRTGDVPMDKGQPKDFSMFGFEYSDAQQGTDTKEKPDEPGVNSTSRPDEVAVDSSLDSKVAGNNDVKRISLRKLESKQSSHHTGLGETTSDDEADPPVRRGRGRPRKSVNTDTVSDDDAESDKRTSDQEEPEVAVRRRSSRIVAEGKLVEKKNDEADSESEDESAAEDFEEREKVKKKGRGRPRIHSKNEKDIETKVIGKRGRGRPRKSESQTSVNYKQTEGQTTPWKSLAMSTKNNRSPSKNDKPNRAVENITKTTAASTTGDFSWIYEQSMAREKEANVSGDSNISPSSSTQKKIMSQDNIFEKMSDTSATSYRLDPTAKVNPDVETIAKEGIEIEKSPMDSSDKSQDPLKSPKSARKFFFLSNEPKKKEKKPILTTTGKNIGVKFNMKEMRFTVSRESKPSTVSPFGGLQWQGQGAVSKAYQRKMEGLHNMQSEVQEKEALLEKKEHRLKIFDRELDKRSSLLKTREGKLARAEQQVHNKERNVDLWEKRLQRMEQKLSTEGSERDSLAELQKEYNRKIKELEFKTQDVQNLEKRLKTKEDRLKNFEASIQRLKQEMGRKQVENGKQEKANKEKEKLLAATEQELTALSLDLSEKFEYLQMKEQEAEQPVSKKDKQAIQNQHSITQFLKRVTSPKETSETESATSIRSKSTVQERTPVREKISLAKLTKSRDLSGKKTLAEKPAIHKSQSTIQGKKQISSPKVRKRTAKNQTPDRGISPKVKERKLKERTPIKEKMSSSTFSPKNNPSGKKKPAEKGSLPKRAANSQEEPRTPSQIISPRVKSLKRSSAKKKTSSPKKTPSNRTLQQARTSTGRYSSDKKNNKAKDVKKQPAKALTSLKGRGSSTLLQATKVRKAIKDSKVEKVSSKKSNRRLTLPAQSKKSNPPSTKKAEKSRRQSAPVTRKRLIVIPAALLKKSKKSITPTKKNKTPSKEIKMPSREKRKSLPARGVSKVQPGKRKRSSLVKDDSLPLKRRK